VWLTFASGKFTSYDEYDPVDPWAVLGAISGFFGTLGAAWTWIFPTQSELAADEAEGKQATPVMRQRRLNPLIANYLDKIFQTQHPSETSTE